MNNNCHRVWSFNKDFVNDWGIVPNVFSKYDCDRIVQYGEELGINPGTVGHNSLDTDIRDSRVSWIGPIDGQTDWIFRRMQDAFQEANKTMFNFDIWGFMEAFQFTRYDAPAGKYNQHIDRRDGSEFIRKLSGSVLLTDPDEFEGGDLTITTGDQPTKMEKRQGALVVFPSFVLHAVHPVTKGTRHSLVAWASGKPFR